MKKCPSCNRSYDDSQSFCLMDGTPLIIENEAETVVSQSPSSPRKKSRFPLIAALLVILFLVLTAGAVGTWLFLKNSGRQTANTQNNRQTVNTKPTSTV